MPRNPLDDAVVQRVWDASPLDLVVGRYLRLRPVGNGQLRGSCPFHAEKFTSFNVAPSIRDGRFHCFGCSADGDVFEFIMRIEQLTLPQAIRQLAEAAGIDYDPGDDPSGGAAVREPRDPLPLLLTDGAAPEPGSVPQPP